MILFYPGYTFNFPGHSYDVNLILPAGNYGLFLYDDFGTGGISATVTTSEGTVLASIKVNGPLIHLLNLHHLLGISLKD